MRRKKVLVDIYLAKNLGDDLFLDHLSQSFPDTDFVFFHPGINYSLFFEQYDNIQQFPYTLIDKIAARFGRNKLTDYKTLSQNHDALLFLGGGIFREESYWKEVFEYRFQITKAFKSQNKKVFFSGVLWGKLFKKEIFQKNNITLHPDLRLSEDLIAVLEYSRFIDKVFIIPDSIYYYNRLDDGGLSRRLTVEKYKNLNLFLCG